jgi:hypothetical protein
MKEYHLRNNTFFIIWPNTLLRTQILNIVEQVGSNEQAVIYLHHEYYAWNYLIPLQLSFLSRKQKGQSLPIVALPLRNSIGTVEMETYKKFLLEEFISNSKSTENNPIAQFNLYMPRQFNLDRKPVYFMF